MILYSSNPPTLPLLPQFDLILLGMGEDGHTASLFPGHPLLKETERWVAPIFDSPKPPPQRITLTLPVLNNARQVAFITAGASKADILPQVFEPGSALPAHLVQPASGKLDWFVDEAAAAQLKRIEIKNMTERPGDVTRKGIPLPLSAINSKWAIKHPILR